MQLRPHGTIWPVLLALKTPRQLREEIFFFWETRDKE